ncbi:MAG: insulinase family protein [Leptospiraceae bacterium]|nr:insulinase family protein [Leptospiraceae bacterium]
MKKILNNRLLWISTISLLFCLVYIFVKKENNSEIIIKKVLLENGLTVYLNEDHSRTEVFGMMVVKVGAKDDPEDATGMAHYQEHVLFKGTQEMGTTDWDKEKPHIDKIFELYDKLGKSKNEEERILIQRDINEESIKANEYAIPNELDNLVSGIGGTNLNASTDHDKTMYYNTFPPHQVEKWLEIYSHRFIAPVFRGFQTELEAVYEEKNMYSDKYTFVVREEFMKHFFKKHPYGQHSVIGTISHLKNPSLTKMYNFFQKYYIANRMALVLSGDFQTDKIIPIIKRKFEQLPKGNSPKPKRYEEASFNGREFVEMNLSPIELALIGFRTIPEGHPDEVVLDVCNFILSNDEKSGLFDKLVLENKVLTADIGLASYNDLGGSIITILPRDGKQTLNEAEKLALKELKRIQDGDFPDWMVDVAKNKLYVDYQLTMESNRGRALEIANIFSRGGNLEELTKYPEKVKRVTKEDVMSIAKKYYGENFLAFYSKIGNKTKEKIQKPDYKPLVTNTKAKSKFSKRLDEISNQEYFPKFIDFKKDMTEVDLFPNVKLFHVRNPLNDIFSLTIRFGIGTGEMPSLEHASNIMNYAGTEKFDVTKLKSEFSKIGCTYSISSNSSYVTLHLLGQDGNLKSAIDLLNSLLSEPVVEKEKLNIVLEEEQIGRKIEKSEPNKVSSALWEYILYKEKSTFKDRLSLQEIRNLNIDNLVQDFLKAVGYEAEIHYVGQLSPQEVSQIFKESLKLNCTKKTNSPVIRSIQKYQEPIVFFVNKNNTIQSKIVFFTEGDLFKKEMEPLIEAFNLYFGEDSSSLLFQEIREYRSLAYSAGGFYTIPIKEDIPSYFVGYLGTQADKTLEAVEVFYQLIKSMPEKKERIGMIKDYLMQASLSNRPDPRYLSQAVLFWKLRGYTYDPLKMNMSIYRKLEFNNIAEFYKKHIKTKPLVIGIVGDKNRINKNELSKYGKLLEIPESELFKD